MAVTVREVAKLSGVSLATVSRYYSGSKVVSTELARKIEEAAGQLGYVHRTKKKRNHGVIAVLVPHLRTGFFGEVLTELLEQVGKYPLRLVMIPTIAGSEDYKLFFQEMNIEGVIYLDEEIEEDMLNYIASKKIRTVMCGGSALNHRSDMVHINDMAAAYEGTKYLIELGHERIVFLSDRLKSISSGYQRLMGCKRAMEEYGLAFDEKEMAAYGMLTYPVGYRLMQRFLAEQKEFTAVFAFSDEVAAGAIRALEEQGRKVPEEVSVLGFDDISLAQRFLPPLTTIHQPIEQFVTKTLDLFLDMKEQEEHMEIMLPFEIVERRSCAARDPVLAESSLGLRSIP